MFNIGSTDIYYLTYYFIIFSFLGWLMETVRVSVRSRHFVNRGFATGPYCPIYGFGMCFVIVFLERFKSNIPLLFILGMLLTTALEYATAAGLERLFNAKWWDYSYKRFNLKGRICLDISIAWGVLSVIMIEVVVPLLDRLIAGIPLLTGELLGGFILILMAVDTMVTVHSIISLTDIAGKLAEEREAMVRELESYGDRFSESLREYIDTAELRERLGSVEEIKEKLKEKTALIRELTLEELRGRFADREFSREQLERINSLRDRYARYEAMHRLRISRMHRRLLEAFPGLEPKDRDMQEIIRGIKDRFENKGL